jgi:[glutamine synthetase] adenylyltransferase / [glutamine synthetase]-adenylyl-L-tyrosine phosphorylase
VVTTAESAAELEQLIERSASPPEVSLFLERLAAAQPDVPARLGGDPALAGALVAVLGASRSLARLCERDPAALEVLAHLEEPYEPLPPESPLDLARSFRLELLHVAARDLVGDEPLETVGRALADLADRVVEAALRLAGADGSALAVIGMGKLGARELNYASDIDLMVVAEDPAGGRDLTHRALDLLRPFVRVDLALRPEGRAGPLVRSLDSYRTYWQRWAKTWEFQALLKARWVAGDPGLGKAFCDTARSLLWDRPFGPDELYEVRTAKGRAEAEVRRRGLAEREIKLGQGGIRDIEFAVQLLQLVHGRRDPQIRAPATLAALEELGQGGYVRADDAAGLAGHYRFLRTVEHRLQLEDQRQVHAIPADPELRGRLARVLGYRDVGWKSALGRFDDDLRQHQAGARRIHERLFFGPLLDALVGLDGGRGGLDRGLDGGRGGLDRGRAERVGAREGSAQTMPEEAILARLAAFGFRDPAATRRALTELTEGMSRPSRLMNEIVALVLEWLSESPDPDLGLLGLRTMVGDRHRAGRLVAVGRDTPGGLRRLCLLLGTGRLFHTALAHQPELLAELDDDAALLPRPKNELVEAARTALEVREGRAARLGLQRLAQEETAHIAARDVLGLDPAERIGAELADLAEAVLQAAVAEVSPAVPMAVVAMGRLGGYELSYSSDLDLLLVVEPSGPGEEQEAERAGTDLVRLVAGETPAERIYLVDTQLRPEGGQGPITRSLAAYRAYHARWGQTWERQALTRARPVAGDPEVGRRFMDLVQELIWERPFKSEDLRAIRRMKARVERERLPPDEDPAFHLKLGRGSLSDVEWTAQLLQLRHRVPSTGTLAALRALVAAGVLDPGDEAVLAEAYRFCDRVRNRLTLLGNPRPDALPTAADQLAVLGRSLGTTRTQLREDYRRVTRRARRVVERLFYGQE